jgi:Trk-type K+ transport system membrane component
MRHSNVYEERSLGIYADDDDSDPSSQPPKLDSSLFSTIRRTFTTAAAPFSTPAMQGQQRSQFVRQQIRGQLSHDMWWLVLAILLISCIEVSNFDRDPVTYSVFNITFEVVSGYGCVGISTGLPNEAYSKFSPIPSPSLFFPLSLSHPMINPFPLFRFQRRLAQSLQAHPLRRHASWPPPRSPRCSRSRCSPP